MAVCSLLLVDGVGVEESDHVRSEVRLGASGRPPHLSLSSHLQTEARGQHKLHM
jgi:hypothetical protein